MLLVIVNVLVFQSRVLAFEEAGVTVVTPRMMQASNVPAFGGDR